MGKSWVNFLREIIVGNYCVKILWENLAGNPVGKSCVKILQEISCEKILRENLARNSCGNFL